MDHESTVAAALTPDPRIVDLQSTLGLDDAQLSTLIGDGRDKTIERLHQAFNVGMPRIGINSGTWIRTKLNISEFNGHTALELIEQGKVETVLTTIKDLAVALHI